MKMNRRGFLKIAFAAGAITAVPVTLTKSLERSAPVIYGDGVHDDTAGLQAAIYGDEFIARNECVSISGNIVHLAAGTYRVSKTLNLTRTTGHSLVGAGSRQTIVRYTGAGATVSA